MYDKAASDKWVRADPATASLSVAYGDKLGAVIKEQIAAKLHFKLMDFDDHLDDLSRRVQLPARCETQALASS